MLRGLGFTVINPAQENLKERISELTNEAMIDCAFEAVSYTHLTLPTICSV